MQGSFQIISRGRYFHQGIPVEQKKVPSFCEKNVPFQMREGDRDVRCGMVYLRSHSCSNPQSPRLAPCPLRGLLTRLPLPVA